VAAVIDRAREKRLRKEARQLGLVLLAPRWRRFRRSAGSFELVDPARNTLLLGDPDRTSPVTLEQIEIYLKDCRRV
jgi:hypothetical protein